MTKTAEIHITNIDSHKVREALVITHPGANLGWCIAVWSAPEYGHTKITGEGHGWQIVRRQSDGRYTYNGTMGGGFGDSLDDIKERICRKHNYILINDAF